MTPVPIDSARELGKRHGAYKLAVLAVSRDGSICITTWGETIKECRAMRAWAESPAATRTLEEIYYEARP